MFVNLTLISYGVTNDLINTVVNIVHIVHINAF